MAASPEVDPERLAFVDGVEERSDRHVVTTLTFDPSADPFLVDHRYLERPVLPAVVALEAMLEAACLLAADVGLTTDGLRDVRLLTRMSFPDTRPRSARVRARREGDHVLCELATGPEFRVKVATAVVPLVRQPEALQRELVEPNLPFHLMDFREEQVLRHGPRLQSVKELALGRFRGWGRLVAPDPQELLGRRAGQTCRLPLSLLDGCFVACCVDTFIYNPQRVEIPHSLERLRMGVAPRPGELCLVQLVVVSHEPQLSTHHFTLFDSAGRVVLDATSFRSVRVGREPQ